MKKFELRQALTNMKPFAEEFKIGEWAIKYTGADFGIRAINNESNPYTDYCAYTWGIKLKQVIDFLINKGLCEA